MLFIPFISIPIDSKCFSPQVILLEEWGRVDVWMLRPIPPSPSSSTSSCPECSTRRKSSSRGCNDPDCHIYRRHSSWYVILILAPWIELDFDRSGLKCLFERLVFHLVLLEDRFRSPFLKKTLDFYQSNIFRTAFWTSKSLKSFQRSRNKTLFGIRSGQLKICLTKNNRQRLLLIPKRGKGKHVRKKLHEEVDSWDIQLSLSPSIPFSLLAFASAFPSSNLINSWKWKIEGNSFHPNGG